MDVVGRYVPSQYLDSMLCADFPYQISHAYANSTCQYWFSILGGPYQMIFAIEERVGSSSVELHTLQCTAVVDLS